MIFITGSSQKFAQMSPYIPGLKQRVCDLPEIQSPDPLTVSKYKLEEAMSRFPHQDLMVEDTSLFLEYYDYKLPGPLIKWHIEELGNNLIYQVAKNCGKFGAHALSTVSVVSHDKMGVPTVSQHQTHCFGNLVEPRPFPTFGWDNMLILNGLDKTLAEMSPEELTQYHYRHQAAQHLAKELYGPKSE